MGRDCIRTSSAGSTSSSCSVIQAPIKDKIEAMIKFMDVTKKKKATRQELESVFNQCAQMKIEVPDEFRAQQQTTIWNSYADVGDYQGAMESSVKAKVLPSIVLDHCQSLVLRAIAPCKPNKEPTGKPIRELDGFISSFKDSCRWVIETHGASNLCPMFAMQEHQIKLLEPTLLHTLKDAADIDIAELKASCTAIKDSQTSMDDSLSLLRAVSLLPVGKSFVSCATKVWESAGWTDAQKVKLQELCQAIQKDDTLESFPKFDAVLINFRVLAFDKEFIV